MGRGTDAAGWTFAAFIWGAGILLLLIFLSCCALGIYAVVTSHA